MTFIPTLAILAGMLMMLYSAHPFLPIEEHKEQLVATSRALRLVYPAPVKKGVDDLDALVSRADQLLRSFNP